MTKLTDQEKLIMRQLLVKGGFTDSSVINKALAWDKVAEFLDKIRPGWRDQGPPLVDRAIEIISELK